MDFYPLAKSLHIIAVIAWMAGLLYLPRLYVYHCGVTAGSEADVMLQTMERKLLRYIMNPAMVAVWALGLWLASILDAWSQGWFHGKMLLVVLLTGAHHMLAADRKRFAAGANVKSAKYFRLLNEAPTVLMIGIVLLVVIKPF